MSETLPIALVEPKEDLADAHQWLARVLTSSAQAEQAIGHLCLRLDLPIKNGPLSSIDQLRARLEKSDARRIKNLIKRIDRWRSLRPLRHVLAHCTLQVLYDEDRNPFIVTRHLPLDREDVTPDRLWIDAERMELLRVTANDGRSISDQVRNILSDAKLLADLQKP
ncbi:hypothetical protein [Qipengyuania sp. ASV99]|uniref:hypothetical protein n=1 Tax=Qipengyuania sp. ASV99 TaxID=3399681 RepID=UPI003A4C5A7F